VIKSGAGLDPLDVCAHPRRRSSHVHPIPQRSPGHNSSSIYPGNRATGRRFYFRDERTKAKVDLLHDDAKEAYEKIDVDCFNDILQHTQEDFDMSVDGNDDLADTEAGGVRTIGVNGEAPQSEENSLEENEAIPRLHEADEAEELGGADGEDAYRTNGFREQDDDDSDADDD